MSNGKCRLHGGKSLAGIASPTYKNGRYSRVMPTRMQPRYDAARTDTALLELREDISLIDARLEDLLNRVDTGESGALWASLKQAHTELVIARHASDTKAMAEKLNLIGELITQGHADYRAWGELASVLEQRRRLVESERKRLVEAQQTLTVENAMLLIGAIGGIIKAHVQDRHVLSAITNDIRTLTTKDG